MANKAVLHSIRVQDVFSEDASIMKDVQQTILKAFAQPDSLGVIAVDGVAGLLESRARLLPLAAQLAALPEQDLVSLEHPKSNFLVGWSRGKEILANGEPDVNKGSFYANPLVDKRWQPASPETESAATRGYHDCNVWPEEDLPALEPAFKATGKLICETATAIMRHCDCIVRSNPSSKPAYFSGTAAAQVQEQAKEVPAECSSDSTGLAEASKAAADPKVGQKRALPVSEGASVRGTGDSKGDCGTCDSTATHCDSTDAAPAPLGVGRLRAQIHVPIGEQKSNKARLLHYYPPDPATYHLAGDWCGWHFDIGTITGLTAAMYLPADCPDASKELGSPDPEAGLHVRSHDGSVVRVAARKDQLLFQVGQSLQDGSPIALFDFGRFRVMSGGLFKATEHYVKAPKKPMDVARCTFAVFCQPNSDDVLQPVVHSSSDDLGVPHWVPGITFGQFRERVTAASCPQEA